MPADAIRRRAFSTRARRSSTVTGLACAFMDESAATAGGSVVPPAGGAGWADTVPVLAATAPNEESLMNDRRVGMIQAFLRGSGPGFEGLVVDSFVVGRLSVRAEYTATRERAKRRCCT